MDQGKEASKHLMRWLMDTVIIGGWLIDLAVPKQTLAILSYNLPIECMNCVCVLCKREMRFLWCLGFQTLRNISICGERQWELSQGDQQGNSGQCEN